MSKVIPDVSIALDGCIAKPNGDDGGLHHWVFGGSYLVEAGGLTVQRSSENSARIFAESIELLGRCHR